jgi:hypothetical protein
MVKERTERKDELRTEWSVLINDISSGNLLTESSVNTKESDQWFMEACAILKQS